MMPMVASFAEAWIETQITFYKIQFCTSPPSRRRGLKQKYLEVEETNTPSPPSRRRGLKPCPIKALLPRKCRLLRGGVD